MVMCEMSAHWKLTKHGYLWGTHVTCDCLSKKCVHRIWKIGIYLKNVYTYSIHILTWLWTISSNLCKWNLPVSDGLATQRIRNTLQWNRNGLDGVSNHQPHHCLLSRLFRCRSKKTSKLRVTGLCTGNSPGTSEFPAQMTSNAENVSIWWRHHDGVLKFPLLFARTSYWTNSWVDGD